MGLVKNIFKGDPVIWIIYGALCLLSIVEVFSATSTLTYNVSSHWAPISRHLIFVFAGFVCAVVTHRIPYTRFRLLGSALLPLALLMLTYITLTGFLVNGAARSINILGFEFQPSEFGKMSVIILTSVLLAGHSFSDFKSRKTFGYIMLVTVPVCLLIFRENFSTAAMLFVVVYLMMFVGRIPMKQFMTLTVSIAVMAVLFVTLLFVVPDKEDGLLHRFGTWKTRVVDFVTPIDCTPDEYDYEDNRQVAHANIAIASSNLVGCMPGNSVQRDFLSQAYSDFIYAIIIEELGLIGGAIVAGLYLYLFVRVGRIARNCNGVFGTYLVMGISILMVMQALINMGVNVGLFPVTGQPLPLVSRGGTSFVINSIYIGMILSVSRETMQNISGEGNSEENIVGQYEAVKEESSVEKDKEDDNE